MSVNCLERAEDFRDKQISVVRTKKSIVVALFFTYCVYTIAIAAKHLLRNSKP